MIDQEIATMTAVYKMLRSFDRKAQKRMIWFVSEHLALGRTQPAPSPGGTPSTETMKAEDKKT